MKRNILINFLIIAVVLILIGCKSKGAEVIGHCEIAIKSCVDSDVQIELDSIIFRDTRPAKEIISHHEISLETVLTIRNTGIEDVMFDIDSEDFNFFNFKVIIKNSLLSDTINFNQFRNPEVIVIKKKSSTAILLGSYDFPFDKFRGINFSNDSLAEIIKSFEMFYETKEGHQICVSQDNNVVVCVQD